MKSTKKKAVEAKKSDEVFAQGRVWSKEQLDSYRNYQKDYMKEKYRSFIFRVSRESEADLVAWLENQDNLAGYIKGLVRKDMDTNKGAK